LYDDVAAECAWAFVFAPAMAAGTAALAVVCVPAGELRVTPMSRTRGRFA
jgi:hypothetical protein